jgi:formate dehydrogenase major subunit
MVRKVVPPLAGLEDWEITVKLIEAMGYPLHYDHPSQILDEVARLSPAYQGMSFALIEQCGSVQWPCNPEAPQGTEVLHTKTFPRGKANFMLTGYVPTSERTDDRFPLLLTTGRILSQYNVGTQTRRTGNVAWYGEDVLDIHPEDAAPRGIADGDLVTIQSRYGETRLHARLSDKVNPGVIYTTFHFAQSKANAITSDLSDWATNCPEYKVTAVEVAKVPVGKVSSARTPAEAKA